MTETPALPAAWDDDTMRTLLVYLAAGLVAGGLPAPEVEDDTRAVAARLGHPDAQVDVAPTSVRLCLRHGAPATIEAVEGSLRLDQLAEVNTVQVGLLTGRLTPEDALAHLRTLRARPHRYSTPGRYLGGLLSATGIALLLQPSPAAVLFAAAVSPVVVSLILLAGRSRTVSTLLPLLAAFPIAVLAFAVADLGWIDAPLRALLPPLAVLLPGGLIVTGLSELAAGAMVAGTSRLVFGTTQLVMFAAGVAAAILLLDPAAGQFDTAKAEDLGWWAIPVGVVTVTVGIALMESMSFSRVPWVLAIVCLTAAFQAWGQGPLNSPWAGAFLGATAAGLGSSVVEFLRPQVSRVLVFLPSFWLLVPGSISLLSLTQYETSPMAAADAVLVTAGMMIAIALGVVVGASLARSIRRVARRTGMRTLVRQVALRRRPPAASPR